MFHHDIMIVIDYFVFFKHNNILAFDHTCVRYGLVYNFESFKIKDADTDQVSHRSINLLTLPTSQLTLCTVNRQFSAIFNLSLLQT